MPFKAGDLQPVLRATVFSQTLVCNPHVGVKTLTELIKKAKKTQISQGLMGVIGTVRWAVR